MWKRCPQTPTWDGGWQGTARSLSCTGEGWQTQLWLMTLRTTWKGRQRCHRGAVNPHSHLSERNMAGYIHNTLLEVKDFQIHLLVKHKTCIMNIHLLCSARVNEDPPLASWISSDSRAYLYSRWTLATLLSKYWQPQGWHRQEEGERSHSSSFHLPWNIRTGWGKTHEVLKRNWNATCKRGAHKPHFPLIGCPFCYISKDGSIPQRYMEIWHYLPTQFCSLSKVLLIHQGALNPTP